MLVTSLRLWVAETNAWLVAPSGAGGECLLVDAPPDPDPIVDRLSTDGLTAVHTPGHTKGSIGRTDLPGGSREELLASMAARILPLPDDLPVLPGHGPTTTIGEERRTNPFLRQLGPG
ncbi:MAG TPA: hypothetical protein VK988_07310 [Acidimicrobiales bacterium]|nr:hypothetical protein [Acidimicrobiales bacterium]